MTDLSLSELIKMTGAEGLKRLIIEVIKLGDPGFDHQRTENKIGLSDPNSCNQKRQWTIQFGHLVDFQPSLSLVMGSSIHHYLQDLIIKHFKKFYNKTLYIEYPVSIDLGYGCEARSWIDILFDAENPEDRIVIDIKTTNKTEQNYKASTLPDNASQINTYMKAVGAKKGYLVVFYLNKVYDYLDESIEVIEVNMDQNKYDEVIGDLKEIFQCIRENKVAKMKFGKIDCAYCAFKLACDRFWEFLTTEIKNPYIRKDYDADIQYIMNQIVYTPGFAQKIDDRIVTYQLNFENIRKARETLLKKMGESKNAKR